MFSRNVVDVLESSLNLYHGPAGTLGATLRIRDESRTFPSGAAVNTVTVEVSVSAGISSFQMSIVIEEPVCVQVIVRPGGFGIPGL